MLNISVLKQMRQRDVIRTMQNTRRRPDRLLFWRWLPLARLLLKAVWPVSGRKEGNHKGIPDAFRIMDHLPGRHHWWWMVNLYSGHEGCRKKLRNPELTPLSRIRRWHGWRQYKKFHWPRHKKQVSRHFAPNKHKSIYECLLGFDVLTSINAGDRKGAIDSFSLVDSGRWAWLPLVQITADRLFVLNSKRH